jgi:hypothetical protein
MVSGWHKKDCMFSNYVLWMFVNLPCVSYMNEQLLYFGICLLCVKPSIWTIRMHIESFVSN